MLDDYEDDDVSARRLLQADDIPVVLVGDGLQTPPPH